MDNSSFLFYTSIEIRFMDGSLRIAGTELSLQKREQPESSRSRVSRSALH